MSVVQTAMMGKLPYPVITVPIRVTVEVEGPARPRFARLSLTVQACDDEKCLMPEELTLELPLPDGQSGAPQSSFEIGPTGVAVAVAAAGLGALEASIGIALIGDEVYFTDSAAYVIACTADSDATPPRR